MLRMNYCSTALADRCNHSAKSIWPQQRCLVWITMWYADKRLAVLFLKLKTICTPMHISSLHCEESIPKIWNKYSLEKELRCHSPDFHINHVFVSDLYISTIDRSAYSAAGICGPILGKYKLLVLTDTRMWKLGLRPRKVIHKWNFRCSV